MIDIVRMDDCINCLSSYFKNNSSDADVLVPEEIQDDVVESIYYLFYSCLLDYGMKSKIYHDHLVDTYHKHPEIFSFSTVYEKYLNTPEQLAIIIRENIHLRYPNVAVKKWLRLVSYFHDNFENKSSLVDRIGDCKSYSQLEGFIKEIGEYGQKTGGLLIRLLFEKGFCSFSKIENIPIDCHDIEISYLYGIIDKMNLNQKEIEFLGKTFVERAEQLGINGSLIDRYLWSIGNLFCQKKKCDDCPLKRNCFKKR